MIDILCSFVDFSENVWERERERNKKVGAISRQKIKFNLPVSYPRD